MTNENLDTVSETELARAATAAEERRKAIKALGLFLKYDESGVLDPEATLAEFQTVLEESHEQRTHRGTRIREILDGLLTNPELAGKRAPMTWVVPEVARLLGAGPMDIAEVKEEVEEFIKQHSTKTRAESSGAKPYTVNRGRGGGMARWDRVKDKA
jgi:hypothetical protein